MGYWCPECHNIFDNNFDVENKQCKKCNSTNVVLIPDDLSIKMGELFTISTISKDNNFCQAMIDLKQKDIIEYNMKLSQFKAQIEQQKSNNSITAHTTKCPKCGSTNIQMIQRKWSLLTGFMTNKVDRVCVNCKYKF